MRCLLILSMFAALGCSEPEALAPAAAGVAMQPAVDLNPDPRIVEVSLIAEPAEFAYTPDGTTAVWGYRDAALPDGRVTVPGPMIEANQGDTLIIHFENALEEGTTVHCHGPRLPNDMDGVPMDGGMVLPGERFDYEFVVDDASTFWYHPHWKTDEQVERGLYGQLVVHGAAVEQTQERFFMLDDVDLDEQGQLRMELSELDTLMGRHGDLLLVNGRPNPIVSVNAGARQRWHFTNAANGRYYQLSLAGHTFTVIGTDGGLLQEPYSTDTLMLAPADRLDVLVEIAGAVGDELALVTDHVDRGFDEPVEPTRTVMTLRIDGVSDGAPPSLDDVLPAAIIEPIAVDDSTAELQLRLGLDPTPFADTGRPEYTVNGERWPFAPVIDGVVGEVAVWAIENTTPTPQPFHLHGTYFQVLDVDGVAAERLSLEDVVSVSAGSTLRFAVRYERAGNWMFHSHILEHAEGGMMRILNLR
jgi:FtsP/CotA-like multicopper oxidase with cupredoxin domain